MVRDWLRWALVVLFCCGVLRAEKVADLPMPTSYVNDFAGVLSVQTKADLEAVCLQLHNQANAEVAVVTIKTLDEGQTKEEFANQLEEKWKLGKKGSDRGLIYLLVLNPHARYVEVGYGLEGILNDAKVGSILDLGGDAERAGDYDGSVTASVDGLAQVIAADSHVTLDLGAGQVVHQYHRQQAQGQQLSGAQVIGGLVVLVIVVILALTGNLGWAFVILQMFMGGGGGGGGGGGNDDDRGGGFGGSGGGESGGGGAGRDY